MCFDGLILARLYEYTGRAIALLLVSTLAVAMVSALAKYSFYVKVFI